jgi:hypothetical protein
MLTIKEGGGGLTSRSFKRLRLSQNNETRPKAGFHCFVEPEGVFAPAVQARPAQEKVRTLLAGSQKHKFNLMWSRRD